MGNQITYKAIKKVSSTAIHKLFKENELNDWFSIADTEYYIKKSLFIASAWDGAKCIGLAVLCGNGKINVELDVLVVDSSYRRLGVATTLMQMVMKKVNKLNPYHFKIEVFEKTTEKLYVNFGFRKNVGTWLLEHGPTGDKLRKKAIEIRKKKKKS